MDEMTIGQKMDLIKWANERQEECETIGRMLKRVRESGPVEKLQFWTQGPQSLVMEIPHDLHKGLTAAITAFLENKMDEQVEALKNFRIELVRGGED